MSKKYLSVSILPMDATHHFQVVSFEGAFDKAGFSEVRHELDALGKSFSGELLVFDFEHLSFINSEGIGYLMELHSYLTGKEKKLVVVGANEHVNDVFTAIGLPDVVTIFDSLDAFKRSLS